LCSTERVIKRKLEKRHELARFLVEYLYVKSNLTIAGVENEKEEVLVEFSVHELKDEFERKGL